MNLSPQEYDKLVRQMAPRSPLGKNVVLAFAVGGAICCLGQAIAVLGKALTLSVAASPMFTSMVLIFLGTTLTGLGVYDRIGKYAGAGSIVPITGFANSITAPAMEFRREGLVMGVGARMFQLAGPVLAYGIASSVAAGILYWIVREVIA